jgi:alpha-D-ribose 1-methylphosphonate 5-triphosphate diphosphatase
MSDEMILTNARIVLSDEVIHGTIRVSGGRITEITGGGTALAAAQDCDGDYLIPGMVELHTDNLDKHIAPRPKVYWPAVSAVVAHDAQIATSGITTVFDSVSIGEIHQDSDRVATLTSMLDGLATAQYHDMLRADHYVHLRCEVSRGELMEQLTPLIDRPSVRVVSLMDHSPGQRQFTTIEQYANYYKKKYNLSDTQFQEFVDRALAERDLHGDRNRRAVVALAADRAIHVASHDDATERHADEAAEAGAVFAEFPTTEIAARALRDHRIKVLTGAPNIVRGGSHSGNVAAAALADAGLVDILSSDYVPASLLPAAFRLHHDLGLALPAVIGMVTANPADAVGLHDRGRIAPGLRADLVRVRERAGLPLIRSVWVEGERVA